MTTKIGQYHLQKGKTLVRIYIPIDMKFIGVGTYVGKEFFSAFESTRVYTPKFRLANGKIVRGYQCWWIPERAGLNVTIRQLDRSPK